MAELQPALPGIKAPPRPMRGDPEILRQAAESLAPEIVRWANDPTVTLESIVADLVKVLTPYNDGYDLARNLEDRGYAPDPRLVEILDESQRFARTFFNNAVKAWVQAHGITLQFPIGHQVATPRGDGTIVELWPATAEYVVATTEEQRAHPGCGYVFNAEDVAAPPVEATGAEVAHG